MSLVAAAVYSGYNAKKGASAQMAGAKNASQVQWDMYNQSREDQMPWLDQGKTSLEQLAGLMVPGGQLARNFTMSDFTRDPGYQFRLDQGMRGVENSAAARGGLLSGNALKALMNYGQDFASNEYMNSYNRFNNDNSTLFNRLAALSNTGQTTANALDSLGATTATNVGNNIMTGAQARASGYAGQANALNGFIDNGLKIAGMFMGQGG